MKKKLTALILAVIAAVAFTACGSSDPVATVNGVDISKDTYTEYLGYTMNMYGLNAESDMASDMSSYLISSTIDSLIYMEELKQACAEKDCLPTEEELKAALYENLGVQDDAAYEDMLSQIQSYYGLSEETLKDVICMSVYTDKLGEALGEEQGIKVTTKDAKKAYKENPDSYDNRTVSHILVSPEVADGREAEQDENGNTIYTDEEWDAAKVKAEKIIKKLDGGTDFAKLAEKYSDDPGSAENGGAYEDPFTKEGSQYVEEFTNGAFDLTEVGQYSAKPVKSSYGYHIILCTGIQDKDHDFDALIEDVRAELLKEKQTEASTKFMEDFDNDADIVIYYGPEANADEAESESEGDETEAEAEAVEVDEADIEETDATAADLEE